MSQLYFNWFKMCFNNEPQTVTEAQLLMAVERGMITEAEHQQIVGNTEPTESPTEPTTTATEPEPTAEETAPPPEEPTTPTEPTI